MSRHDSTLEKYMADQRRQKFFGMLAQMGQGLIAANRQGGSLIQGLSAGLAQGRPGGGQGQGGLLDWMKMREYGQGQQDRQQKQEREQRQYDARGMLSSGALASARQPAGGGLSPGRSLLEREEKGLLGVGYPGIAGKARAAEIYPKEQQPPAGFTGGPAGMTTIPGGPADPAYLGRKAEATREPESSAPFSGKALDAQDSNILLTGDPSSPKYGLAYYRQFQVPKMVMTENGMVPMIIPAPPGIRPPAGGQQGAAAGLGPVAGAAVPGTAKRPTDAQQKAASYGVRLQSSNDIIARYEDLGAELTGYVSGADFFPNLLKSSDRQQLEQAQRDFINAQLRRESGAVIADSEFDNAAKQYFPQPGDGVEVIAQKRRAREIAIQNMGKEAGRAQRAAPPPAPRAEAGPQVTTPSIGTVDGGYRFKGGDPADENNWEKVR